VIPALAADGDRDDDHQHLNQRNGIRHVLLISIDGMHAVDYSNCVKGGYCPNLAALGQTGVSYTNTSTSKPSDSFPGLMALVTGGTPRLVGAYYDVAYDRVLAPPARASATESCATARSRFRAPRVCRCPNHGRGAEPGDRA